MSQLDPSVVRRLAFIKYLYQLGVRQSRAPEPLAGAALLTLHDATELFLQLASEHLNAGGQQPGFMTYWNLLKAKLPEGSELSQKEAMRRLNKARVALKHNGTFPSKLDLESFRGTAANFFLDNTPLIFDLSFDEVSLIDFVQPEESRNHLKSAQDFVTEGKYREAASETALAFDKMLSDYEHRKVDGRFRSRFDFGAPMHFMDSFFLGLNRNSHSFRQDETVRKLNELEGKLAKFVDNVKISVEALQNSVKIIAFGVDYRQYSMFRAISGDVIRAVNGGYHVSAPEVIPTKEEAQFCIDFVIEAAIALREFDHTVDDGEA